MSLGRLLGKSLLVIALLGFHGAHALTVDDAAGVNKDGSAKFNDPDDAIPFPHMADDGQPVNSFQAQSVGNSGMAFGFTPSQAEPGAFERAQQRMQQ